jgi:RND superfamily putative drug exporter
MSSYLYRLALWSFNRRRLVLLIWIVVAVAAIGGGALSGGKENNSFTIPGTESQQAANLLSQKLPALAGGQTQVVFASTGSAAVTSAAYKAGIEASVRALAKVPQVVSVSDPFTTKLISPDGKAALSQVLFSAAAVDVKNASLTDLQNAGNLASDAGLKVAYGGSVYPGVNQKLSEAPELIGILIAFVILLVTFGAFAAAGMPILNAIIGVLVTVMSLTALAAVVNIASVSTTVAIMLGLSTGIDYGLFILSRHRAQLLTGMPIERSVGMAVGTAGSSVVFAGLTVIIALCGLSVVGIPFLTVMGLAAAGAVLVSILIALTLLPAMLGFFGNKVAKFISSPLRPGHNEEVAKLAAHEPERTAGAHWARFTVRRRIPLLIAGILLLLVIASPATKIHLGLPGGDAQAKSTTERQAYDLTSQHFGVGFNAPLLAVASPITSKADIETIAGRLVKVPDVQSATPAAAQNGLAVIQVIPTTGPNATATSALVKRIRSDRAQIEAGTGATVLIGGTTASNIDVSNKLSSALPIFLVVVVGLAFVLLTFAFRTILVPIKSILGFLLSVSAAMGAEVAIFQWGWGASLLGVTKTETLSFLPIILLAIIFGLSSDYEVFVVSRIKEDFTKTGDARGAVARGAGVSVRVVTAAALIMFSIFVAFMTGDNPETRAIAFAFAIGVFLDAFIVRLTLVPAIMAVVQAKLWYHPQWFSDYVPNPDIEGERLAKELAIQDSVTAEVD